MNMIFGTLAVFATPAFALPRQAYTGDKVTVQFYSEAL